MKVFLTKFEHHFLSLYQNLITKIVLKLINSNKHKNFHLDDLKFFLKKNKFFNWLKLTFFWVSVIGRYIKMLMFQNANIIK